MKPGRRRFLLGRLFAYSMVLHAILIGPLLIGWDASSDVVVANSGGSGGVAEAAIRISAEEEMEPRTGPVQGTAVQETVSAGEKPGALTMLWPRGGRDLLRLAQEAGIAIVGVDREAFRTSRDPAAGIRCEFFLDGQGRIASRAFQGGRPGVARTLDRSSYPLLLVPGVNGLAALLPTPLADRIAALERRCATTGEEVEAYLRIGAGGVEVVEQKHRH